MRHLDSPAGARGLLDRTMPRWLCGAILLVLAAIPVLYVALHYSREHGFTSLILFGSAIESRELPEVKAQHPALVPGPGYDGQYYAQLAMHPTMLGLDDRQADLQIHFRSQRYLPIVLPYLLGLGQPRAILTLFVLQHLVFWLGLLALLAAYFRGRTVRQYLCLTAAAMTTGALICIERCLGDLPGATLVLASVLVDGLAATLLIALAMLCKPTFFLALARHLWPLPANWREAAARAGLVAAAVIPLVVVATYLFFVVGPLTSGKNNFGLPFVAWTHAEVANVTKLFTTHVEIQRWAVTEYEWRLFEIVVPFAFLAQAIHLAIWRDLRSPIWWLGAAFALLFVIVGPAVTAEEISSARTLLPLTLVFNLRLAAQRGSVFSIFYVIGNLPLLWCARDMICFCVDHT